MIISRKILRNLILLGIMSYLGCFGYLLFADAQKKKVHTKQAPPKMERFRPFRVYGIVRREGTKVRPVKNIRVKLIHIPHSSIEEDKKDTKRRTGISTQMSAEDSKKKSTKSKKPELNKQASKTRIKKMRIPPKICITDEKGRYSFSIDAKNKGQKFTLKAWHPLWPEGRHIDFLWVKKKDEVFILDRNRKIDFQFYAPSLPLFVHAKTFGPHGAVIRRSEIALDEVLGPGQYKPVEFDEWEIEHFGGFHRFYIDFEYFNKKIRIQARHPQREAFGDGMSPKEKTFKPTLEKMKVVFLYIGPTPDLTLPHVRVSPNCLAITVENKGNLKTGPFILKVNWSMWSTKYGKRIYPPEFRQKVEFREFEAKEKRICFFKCEEPHYEISFYNAWIDYKEMVAESNEKNNKIDRKDSVYSKKREKCR